MIWSVKQEAIIGNDLCSHGPFMQKIINVSTNHQTKKLYFYSTIFFGALNLG